MKIANLPAKKNARLLIWALVAGLLPATIALAPTALAATSIVTLTDAEELVFTAANRVLVVGDGKSNGNIVRYKNVIVKNGQSVDAVITTNINTTEATITDYDNPGSASTATGSGNYFQINMNTTSSTAVAGGAADFTFAFYEGGTYTGVNTGIPVVLQNVRMTSIDLDTSGTGGFQYTDFTGFQKYSLTSITNLGVQSLSNPSRTRFISAKAGARSSVPEDQVMVRYDSISKVTITVGNPVQSTTNYYGVTFGGWPNGGTPVERTNSFNVPPTSTNQSLAVPTGVATTLPLTSFGTFADADDNPFIQIRIGALPTTGTLQYLNGTTWTNMTAGQIVSVADIELGKMRFTGSANTSFTFAVYDGLDYSLSNNTLSLTVVASAQTITFANPLTKAPSATPFASAATASSSLTVTLTSNTTGVCTVSGLDITAVAAGTCSITATQAGNGSFGAATPVTQVFPVSSSTAQTITFNNPGAKTMSSTPFASNATASSTLPVTLVSNTPSVCTVSSLNIVMVTPGSCSITANQSGDGSRAPAPSVTQTFVISAGAPTVITQDATSITSTGATLNGTVNSYSLSAATTFCWGTSPTVAGSGALSTCTSTTATQSPITSSIATAASKALTGLTNNTTYYFQIVAVSSSGTSYGAVKSFIAASSAPAARPTAVTFVASSIVKDKATLNGAVNPNNSAVTAIRFCLSTSSANSAGVLTSANCSNKTASPSSLIAGASTTNVSVQATSLQNDTLYFYQTVAINAVGTSYGAIKQFYTLNDNDRSLKAVTNAASSVTSTSATLNGVGRSNSSKNSSTLQFCWGTSSEATLGELNKATCTLVSANPSSTKTTSSDVSTSYALSGLAPGTTYYYQAITSRSSKFGYGEVVSFSTNGAAPTVSTLGATAIAGSSATLNGTANSNGTTASISFCYGTSATLSGCTTATSTTPTSTTGSSSTAARADIGNLVSGTRYYFRISATNGSGTTNGSILNFVAGSPTAITLAPSEILGTSATLNGAVKANGLTTTPAFCWGTNSTVSAGVLSTCAVVTPTPSSVESTTATTTSITFALSGLTAATTYYYQARATGNGGTNYGEVVSFTASSAPTVSTQAANSITSSGATLNGTVNAQGVSTLNLFCLSETNTATDGYLDACDLVGFYEATPTSSSGSNNTSISLAITGLNPATTYYFQAVGDNARGTTPGAILSFTSSNDLPGATTAKPTVNGLSATLNGSAIANGASTTVTFLISTTGTVDGNGILSNSPVTITPTANVISVANGFDLTSEYLFDSSTALTAGTTFHYQIKATNSLGTAYGAVEMVITGSPTVITLDPSAIDSSTATLNGSSNANGANTNNYLVWGVSAATDADGNLVTVTSETATTGATSTGSSVITTAKTITGLTEGQIYFYQAKSTNSRGTSFGAIKSFAAGERPQTITFAALTTITYGDAAPAMSSSTTSGLVETFTVVSGPCSITQGGELTVTGAGNCVISAQQSGGVNDGYLWGAAVSVSQTLIISPKTLIIKASSHTVGRNSSTVITYSPTFISFVGSESQGNLTGSLTCSAPGLDTATAGSYDSICAGVTSTNYAITFETGTVTVTDKQPQTITFAAIADKSYLRSSESLTATTDASGLTVTYTVSGNCTLTPPDTLVITGAGTCTVTASQSGDATFAAAQPIVRTFTINRAPLTITASSHSIATGSSVSISATYAGFVSSETVSDLSGTLVCSTTYTTTSAAGTYPSTCTGLTSSNYDITYVAGSVVATGTPPGGGSSPTPPTTNNPGVPPAKVIKKTAVATLVTTGTKKVTTTIEAPSATPRPTPSPSATPRPTPSPSATPRPTPSPSATPRPTPSPSASSSATPRPTASPSASSSATPRPTPSPSATPRPTPSPSASSSATPRPTPSPSATPEVLTPISFTSRNLQSVVLVGDQLTVVAKEGFSGIAKVTIEVKNDEVIERINTTVTVLPLPAVAPLVTPTTPNSTVISWEKSPNATGYLVTDENGNTLCKTSKTQCRVSSAIPASNTVEVIARGRDNLLSEPVEATFVPRVQPTPTPTPEIPVASVVVNFDTNKFALTSQEKRELDAFVKKVISGGFKELDISGHTDSDGGVDNNVLSLNRAKQTRAYILQFVPDLKITLGGFADAVAVANNSTAAGKAANRRAEVRIIK